MATYQQILDKMLKAFVIHRKLYDSEKSKFEKTVDAANAFTSAYAKSASKLADGMTRLMEAHEQCGRTVAELSVYEDELAKAEKAKDKKKIQQAKKKMDPLIKKFNSDKALDNKIRLEWNKEKATLTKLKAAIASVGA